MSSDSECSFETFGPDFAISERTESASTLATLDDDTLRIEMERLRMENELLRKEMMDRFPGSQSNNTSLLRSQIAGSWKLDSSSNVDEYLSRRGASEVSDIVFQVGDVHFDVNDDNQQLTVFHQIGHKKYEEKRIELGRPQWEGSVSSSTYFTEHCMKTVYAGRASGGEDVEEVSIHEGRLHILIRRWGLSCERVYSRSGVVGAEDPIEWTSKIEKIKREYEGMYRKKEEYWNLEAQLKIANYEIDRLKLEEIEEQLESANLKIKNMTEENEKLKLEISKLEETNKKEELSETDIRKTIVGLWEDTCYHDTISFKVEGNQFMFRWNPSNEYSVSTFGVKRAFGATVTVEGDRIIERWDGGRYERYVENGQLVWEFYKNDKLDHKFHYRRIGGPL